MNSQDALDALGVPFDDEWADNFDGSDSINLNELVDKDYPDFDDFLESISDPISDGIDTSRQDRAAVRIIKDTHDPKKNRGVKAAAQSSVKPRARTTVVSLRPWIRQAIHSICHNNGERAVTSQVYLESALIIAKSLANQIIQAEELYNRYGISTKLDSLSVGRDWAEHVTVQLDEEDESDNLGGFDDELVSLPENEELESYLVSLEKNVLVREGTVEDHAKTNLHYVDKESKAVNQSFGGRQNSVEQEQEQDLSFPSSGDMKYHQVSSAKIECREGECVSGDDNSSKENSRRIYYLGLVFYELFTGGEIPPENLRTIALCKSAFVSLSTMTLVNKTNEGEVPPSNGNNKRHQGQSTSSNGDIGLCELSSEYLRLIGITVPICNLIFNMLDSVYGDLSGNESYANMTQVAYDLRLMIEKPSKFLRGLDMDKVSVSGLPINEIDIPREDEFETIKSCYNRSISGSSEITIIRGESGTGKSWLAYRLGQFVISSGGLVLTGKFDQMQQAKPFSALASSFDQYCDLLLSSDDHAMVESVTDDLNSSLGEDVHLLFKVIPKLKILMAKYVKLNKISCDNEFSQTNGNAMLRLQYLISTLIDVISTNSAVSVVLFMDDLQWIDEASLFILKTVLTQKHRKFFFLGCYRDDEVLSNANDHKFWKMMHSINAAGVNVTEIKLNCMNEETVRTVVSDLLCISLRLVRSLSSVLFNRSKGNVLFFMQLLLLLYRDGLLYLDLGRQRWKWDEDKIVSLKLPDNIAICLSNGICKLSIEVQLALNTLSMFGASAKLSYLKLLESNLHMRIIEPLKEAEAEGLVTNTKGSFKFCHDRIQEASLNLTEEQYRRINHLAYGKCLAQKASEANDIDLLFTAVHQINFGGPSAVTEHKDYFDMANHNLAAGKQAMRMAEFTSALSFFKHGISFLRGSYWQDHYVFSLEIYELACKTSFSAKKISDVNFYCEQVLKNAHTFEDTLEIQLIRMTLLAYIDATKALELGLSIVSKLGEQIPAVTAEALDLKQVQSVVEGIPLEHFLNYKMMSDTKKLIVMRFLSRIQIIAYHAKPSLNPPITLKMLQVTISHGLSLAAPAIFVYFGNYLAKLGDLSLGYRYAILGKALLNNLGLPQQTGEVIAGLSPIQTYCEPAPAVLEMHIRSVQFVISQGDMYWACINQHSYCTNAIWIHRDLSFVKKLLSEARVFFEQQEQKICLAYNAILQRVVLVFSGNENEAMAFECLLTNITEPKVNENLSFYNLYLSYLMNHDNLKECYEVFLAIKAEEYFITSLHSLRAFIAGLAAFRIYRETRDSLWMSLGTEHMREMRAWAERGSSWNFQHKLQLMEAEYYYCNGNFEQAEQSYTKAIASATSHKYINDEALACELAGRFFLERDHVASSLEYWRLAHEKYFDWGAVGKANQLLNFINAKFAVSCKQNDGHNQRLWQSTGTER